MDRRLKSQRDLGVDVSEEAIEDYQRVIDQIDLESIDHRERITRHDVKARIEEFNAIAGHQQIHKGMTSRDLTENVEQLQIRQGLELVRDRSVAALSLIGPAGGRILRTGDRRSQPQCAGPSDNDRKTVCQRRAKKCWLRVERMENLLLGIHFEESKARSELNKTCWICFMATLQNWMNLTVGSPKALASMNASIRSAKFIHDHWISMSFPGLSRLSSAPANFARTLRLMAGAELGNRRFPAWTGRFVGDAAQDERAVSRADRWIYSDLARLPVDDRGVAGRPVERG